jgi:hypothetical protein
MKLESSQIRNGKGLDERRKTRQDTCRKLERTIAQGSQGKGSGREWFVDE